MRLGDAFAGIGGFSLAATRCGIDIAWQIELDPWCQRVLAKHWPDVPRFDDIRTVDPDALPAIDILTAGFPCQPVSSAGKRQGEADPRWLWPDTARLIRSLRPAWVLLENVSELRSRGMGTVVGELAACGYDCQWDCVPAAALGAAHYRDRVWIVAYPHSARQLQPGWAFQTFRERSSDGFATAITNASRISQRESTVQTHTIATSGEAWSQPGCDHWWSGEPAVARMVHGLPGAVDRRRGLGNAIVPQIAEFILRWIVEAEFAA